MSTRSFTLAGVAYECVPLTMKDMKRIVPLMKAATIDTVPGMQAMSSLLFEAVKKTPQGAAFANFDAFEETAGITPVEMLKAYNEIGLACGYLSEKKPAPAAPEEKAADAPLAS